MKFFVLLLFLTLQLMAEKPNVIIIYVDDMGWSGVGCYGCDYIDTPEIDAMCKEGMKFTNAYSPAPNCSPSRASLLTGLYPPRHGITQYLYGNKRVKKFKNTPVIQADLPPGLDTKFTTLAELFKKQGYATASIGKWHLGNEAFYPEKHGFDINIGGTSEGHHSKTYPPYMRTKTKLNGKEGEHITECLQRHALDFVSGNTDKPFFLYLPLYSVHLPFGGNEELTEKYKKQFPNDKRKVNYCAMTEGVDRLVGAVRKKLSDLKLSDNTLIIFSSDNGGVFDETCEHLRAKKGFIYEGGIKVPMIVVGKGISKGVCDTPVNHIDVMPTLIEFAGLNENENDGVSLMPILSGEGAIPVRDLFWHYPHYANSGGKPGSVVRSGNYKLIKWYDDDSYALYNLEKDEAEKNDLAASQPERVEEMKKKLNAWLKETKAIIPKRRN